MESIEDMWQKFSLSEKEGLDVDLARTSQQTEHILGAKFLTTRVLNIESVARTFKPLWKTRQSFTVQDLGRNRVAFAFEDEMDLERVLVNEPWSYDKSLVVFQRLHDAEALNDSKFSHVSFWVQLHNLPIRRMTAEAAEAIGKSIGEVEKVAKSDDERGGENCMRIRVRMEITSPLCRGRLVKLEEGQRCWVAFRYERLPNFCYWCGCLDHGEKDCDVGLQQRKSGLTEEQQFGAWLRATSDRPPRRTVVTVLGNQTKGSEKMSRTEPQRAPTTAMPERHTPIPSKDGIPEFASTNPETDMEVEPNPGTADPLCLQRSTTEDFYDQLREIDREISFVPAKENLKEKIKVPIISSPLNMEIENIRIEPPMTFDDWPSHRAPLCDISNGPPTHVGQKKNPTKWKKLARAQSSNVVGPDHIQSPKRIVPHAEESLAQLKKQKVVGDQYEGSEVLVTTPGKVSVEAGLQPCRQP